MERRTSSAKAFIELKRQFLKLAFREVKQISPNAVSVTYELTYLDQGKGRDAKVTNKKFAQMLKEQGKWVVGSVRNIKGWSIPERGFVALTQ